MTKVIPINAATLAEEESTPVSLEAVFQAMEDWRRTKSLTGQHSIPPALWHQIFALAKVYTPSKIQKIFGLSASQYQLKLKELTGAVDKSVATPSPTRETVPRAPSMGLCEVQPLGDSFAQAFEADIPLATNTLIVEFCRADGKIMKIHTTTESFSALMKAFFCGF